MAEFISNISGQSFYMPPVIAPFSIRKYSAGVNTTNGVFQIQDGVFFIMSREVDSDDNKHKIYYIHDNYGIYETRSIDIDSGEVDGFIIDGGEWS